MVHEMRSHSFISFKHSLADSIIHTCPSQLWTNNVSVEPIPTRDVMHAQPITHNPSNQAKHHQTDKATLPHYHLSFIQQAAIINYNYNYIAKNCYSYVKRITYI